jgi:hypothetical protein
MTSSHSMRVTTLSLSATVAGRRCCGQIILERVENATDLITEDFDLAIAAVADGRRVARIVEGVDLQVQWQALSNQRRNQLAGHGDGQDSIVDRKEGP